MTIKNNYIDNEKLKKELVYLNDTYKQNVKKLIKEGVSKKLALKKAKGDITDELGEMFLKIANNLINRPNFNNYTYKDEMIGLAIEYLCRFAKNYNKNKKDNSAFCYCTTICYHGFLQAIEKENKKIELKDRLIKESMESSELEKWIAYKNNQSI